MVGITGIIGPDGMVQHLPSQEPKTDADATELLGHHTDAVANIE